MADVVTIEETRTFGSAKVRARITYRVNEERVRRVEEQAAQFVLHNLINGKE